MPIIGLHKSVTFKCSALCHRQAFQIQQMLIILRSLPTSRFDVGYSTELVPLHVTANLPGRKIARNDSYHLFHQLFCGVAGQIGAKRAVG